MRVMVWLVVAAVLFVPLGLAAGSPFLEWRSGIYIVASFAGIAAFGVMVIQPLAILGVLSGVAGRRLHRWAGAFIALAVIVHVAGLWVTSPPDVVDALTFTSPTSFSIWGVLAMWAVFASAVLAVLRFRFGRLRWRTWRVAHMGLVVVIVAGTVAHALLIEGVMDPVSKIVLSVVVGLATLWGLAKSQRA